MKLQGLLISTVFIIVVLAVVFRIPKLRMFVTAETV